MTSENPVKVVRGSPDFSGIPELVGKRTIAIVATDGAEKRGTLAKLRSALGSSSVKGTTTGVRSNPTIASIQQNADEVLRNGTPDLLIAIGGGSTLDSAKGIASIAAAGGNSQWLSGHLRDSTPFPDDFDPPSIVAIPTTAGTGSEVTMWGTVWDETSGAKYSISHQSLYPEYAVMIPELTLSADRELTLFTALDALSHCMESLWSTRSSLQSQDFAMNGIRKILASLDNVLERPSDLSCRRDLQEGALFAGYAISFTRTALAHSMSYPMTSSLGMPHGLACSFTLPAMIRFNAKAAPDAIMKISKSLGARSPEDGAEELERRYSEWGVPEYVSRYADRQRVTALASRLITPGRADNNVRQATADDALAIVLESLPA